MPNFRWPLLQHDIFLAKEAISKRPEKALDWNSIATNLSKKFSTEEKPIVIKGRACRERLDLLVRKYRDEDTKALKRYATSKLAILLKFAHMYL